MLTNKAQIARESIKTTLELPGPFSGPWTPAESEFGFALVMCMLAHNLLRLPQMKILDPPPCLANLSLRMAACFKRKKEKRERKKEREKRGTKESRKERRRKKKQNEKRKKLNK